MWLRSSGQRSDHKFRCFCCCCCCCCCSCWCLLFVLLLLLLLVVLLLVVVVAAVVVVVASCHCRCRCRCYPCSFFLSPVVAENRQIGGVFTFFLKLSRSKKNMFFGLGGQKKHEIYNVFWPVPSKNTNIYAVFRLLGFVEGAERGVY